MLHCNSETYVVCNGQNPLSINTLYTYNVVEMECIQRVPTMVVEEQKLHLMYLRYLALGLSQCIIISVLLAKTDYLTLSLQDFENEMWIVPCIIHLG